MSKVNIHKMKVLQGELAPGIVPVVLANVTTRYPYHDAHLTESGEPPHDPFASHPAFGNSFDWHSSVHSHWTALQLIEHYAIRDSERPEDLRALERIVSSNLSAPNITAEMTYLAKHRSYERPYGWAWAMALAAAAHESKHPLIQQYTPQLGKMAEVIADSAVAWLSVLPMPVRHGVHSNTAFALGLMHDAARVLGLGRLDATIADRALTWFGSDRNWPVNFERSGNDFLSPGLTVTDLMRRLLSGGEFASWWREFVPGVSFESPMLSAVSVPDVSDGQVVHLHGLNLSRAGVLARAAQALQNHEMLAQAVSLYEASVGRAVMGHYTETHWLPTFAWDAATSIDEARADLR